MRLPHVVRSAFSEATILALLREVAGNVLVTVIADLSMLEPEQLWAVLDHHSRVYPYDEDGRRVDVADIAKRVEQLKDDPFRSLAGELQRTGGCAKDMTPFSEFLWTDFLRRRLGRRRVEKNFSVAAPGNEIGQDANARYLPGWCGPADRRPPNG